MSPLPLAGVRAGIVAALDGAVSIPVHTYSPGTSAPPYIYLKAGSPYRDPSGWRATTVNIDVRIAVNAAGGPAAQATLDDLIDTVAAALDAASVAVGVVPDPAVDPDQGLLYVDLPTRTVWKED